jgi:hypothetical protein
LTIEYKIIKYDKEKPLRLQTCQVASRDTKTNIFQEGSAEFKTTIDLNKKEVHQGDVYAYVENVDLISLRQTYNYREREGKSDKNNSEFSPSQVQSLPRYIRIF